MSEFIEADDLAMLASSFEAAMADAPGPSEADQALYDLGWVELLASAPDQGAATAFSALGKTNSAASLLDDVVANALGAEAALESCCVFPAPHKADVPGHLRGETVMVDGLLSARAETAVTTVLSVVTESGVGHFAVDAGLLHGPAVDGIDPGRAYHRVVVEIPAEALEPTAAEGSWESAVAGARVALAHQLLGGARWMLGEARQHAIDRAQFGRPVAQFQAIRHKLAESLVQIEGAASVAGACLHDPDPMLAALAKSLAGQAARTTATHAQQVLAGIGFTAEHRFHYWLKRMLVVDTLFGSASSIPVEIGQHLLSEGTAPRLIQL